MPVPPTIVKRLRAAFRRNELTLYTGAGVSVASGLPTWGGLLRVVFINSLHSVRHSGDIAAFQAVAETWLSNSTAPLDVAARELRGSFATPDEFLKWVRFALYPWLDTKPNGLPKQTFVDALRKNRTLSAVAKLSTRTKYGRRGLLRVINYNFDNLLELRLGKFPHTPVWSPKRARPTVLPVYHVHGYLPARSPWTPYPKGTASSAEQIVLTEDQYHREASVPYGWSNLIQLESISDSVGLAVGLSMTDPNLRRLLDIGAQSSATPEIYSLLPKPPAHPVTDAQMTAILDHTAALVERNAHMFGRAYVPFTPPNDFAERCQKTWDRIDRLAVSRQVKLMSELGVQPVWCEHEEIPDLFDSISRP